MKVWVAGTHLSYPGLTALYLAEDACGAVFVADSIMTSPFCDPLRAIQRRLSLSQFSCRSLRIRSVMDQMTFRIPSEVTEYIEGEASNDDVSKSEVVRNLLEMGMEYEELRSENERLRKQLQATNRQNEVNDKLVRYVEHDIDYHEAGIVTKAKWFLFGK